MDAPTSLEEIFERKKLARKRFAHLPLIERMQIAYDLAAQMDRTFGKKERKEQGIVMDKLLAKTNK